MALNPIKGQKGHLPFTASLGMLLRTMGNYLHRRLKLLMWQKCVFKIRPMIALFLNLVFTRVATMQKSTKYRQAAKRKKGSLSIAAFCLIFSPKD